MQSIIAFQREIYLALSHVCLIAIVFRKWLARLLETKGAQLHGAARFVEAASGAVLILIAAIELHSG
ncbi:hypothetical protein E0H22_15390 [Rhodopseudomonas boonkerdii]|uniref:hypothetical protein n=1 Tax=Rhodopseudomonas boonkerdii TaxID=475937 RepID=UPI001E4F08F3|nr:hypothetical protein [Rhodopseudomonas boonkerdii]UGV26947.1 hypothetical protein E0H22_15390 [Rhodopseudomonas boonkerdii]